MEMIALLVGVFLGAKCQGPLNALFAVLDARFSRYWGLGLYALLAALLINALGDLRGLLLALGLPALYVGHRALRAWEDRRAKAGGSAATPSAYGAATNGVPAGMPMPMPMPTQGLVYAPYPFPVPTRRRRRVPRPLAEVPLAAAPPPPVAAESAAG